MLTIIIGGKAQGKLSYVLKQSGYSIEDVCDGEELCGERALTAPIWNHFHLYIRRLLQENSDISNSADKNRNYNISECVSDKDMLWNTSGDAGIVDAIYKTCFARLHSDEQDRYLICDEVGSGVVPMDAFERQYRETVGRVMCRLTPEADQVIRVQCGIGTILKEISLQERHGN